jgi:hypothetical protein
MTDNNNISDGQLLLDIENTIKEYQASIYIAEGYKLLSELPIREDQKMIYLRREEMHRKNIETCKTSLNLLKHLKNTRGL